jgi:flagellar biosynthesis protein FlhG
MRNMPSEHAEFWVFVSGKGGVGKSVLALNMARELSEEGKRVLLLDADLGLANLHVLANVDPRGRLERVLARAESLEEAITPLPFGPHLLAAENGQSLCLLSGSEAALGLADTLGRLHASYDFVLVDTPRGLSDAALRFCRACDRTLLVTSDEPTAITNTYAWFKLARLEKQTFPIWILANESEDPHLKQRFLDLCLKFLGVAPYWAGQVPHDPQVARSVSRQKPLWEEAPRTPAWVAIQKITRNLQRAHSEAAGTRNGGIMPSSRSAGRPG